MRNPYLHQLEMQSLIIYASIMKRDFVVVASAIVGLLLVLAYVLIRMKFFGIPDQGTVDDKIMVFQCIVLFLTGAYNNGAIMYKNLNARKELADVQFQQKVSTVYLNSLAVFLFTIPNIISFLKDHF